MGKYIVDLKEDVNFTKDAVNRGEVSSLIDFANRRKGMFLVAGALAEQALLIPMYTLTHTRTHAHGNWLRCANRIGRYATSTRPCLNTVPRE